MKKKALFLTVDSFGEKKQKKQENNPVLWNVKFIIQQ